MYDSERAIENFCQVIAAAPSSAQETITYNVCDWLGYECNLLSTTIETMRCALQNAIVRGRIQPQVVIVGLREWLVFVFRSKSSPSNSSSMIDKLLEEREFWNGQLLLPQAERLNCASEHSVHDMIALTEQIMANASAASRDEAAQVADYLESSLGDDFWKPLIRAL